MVGVGKLHIQGTIDTKDLDRGFAKIKTGFVDTRKESKSTLTDFNMMDIVGKGLARTFVGIGAAAIGFMYQASKVAPALQGSMAVIEVSWMRMLRSFGEGAAPAFESFSNGLEKVASWTEKNPELFAGTVVGGGILALLIGANWGAISAGIGSIGAAIAGSPLLLPIAAGTVLAGLIWFAGYKAGWWGQQEIAIPDNAHLPQLPEKANTQDVLNSIDKYVMQSNTIDVMGYQSSTLSMREKTMGQTNTFFNG